MLSFKRYINVLTIIQLLSNINNLQTMHAAINRLGCFGMLSFSYFNYKYEDTLVTVIRT